jgi:hypothetical protein
MLDECQNVLTRKEKEYSELHISLGYRAHEFNHSLSQTIKATDNRTTETVKNCLEELKVSSDDTITFGTGHYNHIGQFQDGVFTFNYKPYVVSGETPMKKSYEYPHKLTHSRPETEIITSYRQSQDPSYTEPPAIPETSISSPPSEPEIQIPEVIHEEPQAIEPPARSSLPSSKVSKLTTGPKGKPNSEPNGRSSIIPVVNNKPRNIPKVVQTQPARKVSIGGSSGGGKPTENTIMQNKMNQASLAKERNRLGDLTNQVNKT